jgi:cyclic beta-1,2-glucan synthetase
VAPGATVHAVFVSAGGWSDEAALAALRRCDTLAPPSAWPSARRRPPRPSCAASGSPRRAARAGRPAGAGDAPREALRAGLAEAGPLLPVLWSLGVSGDLPIVLLRVADEASLPFVLQVLRGHAWWRGRQVGVDLLLLDELSRGYDTPLRDRLERAVHEVARRGRTQGPGRAVVLPVERVGADLPTLLAAAAVVLDADGAPLHEQLARAAARPTPLPAFVPVPGPLAASTRSCLWRRLAEQAGHRAGRLSRAPGRCRWFAGLGGPSAASAATRATSWTWARATPPTSCCTSSPADPRRPRGST